MPKASMRIALTRGRFMAVANETRLNYISNLKVAGAILAADPRPLLKTVPARRQPLSDSQSDKP
jgi:hypothetical protein